MASKPRYASGYDAEYVEHVRSVCLFVATKLGDLLDEIVIVGGLVPSLIVSQSTKNAEERHVGTNDLDLGLALGLLDEQRYQALTERLRNAGFVPDTNEKGARTHQRWKLQDGSAKVTIDFLIPPTGSEDQPGKLKHIGYDFAAIITRGLPLAFQDRQQVSLVGRIPSGAQAARGMWVCGVGAFIVLKAFAFRNRGERKDAYDLTYVLQHYGTGIAEVAAALEPLLVHDDARVALEILDEDFTKIDSLGAFAVAEFLGDRENDAVRADASGAVRSFLEACRT